MTGGQEVASSNLASPTIKSLVAPRTHLSIFGVSTIEQPDESRVHVYSPDEALKSARPLPKREDLLIEDVSDEEWAAFLEALAEA